MSFLLRLAHDNSLRVLKSKSGEANGSAEHEASPPETVLFNQIEVLSSQILKKKEKDERKKRKAQKAKAMAKAKAKAEGVDVDTDEVSDSDEDDEGCCAPEPDVKERSGEIYF